MCWGVCGGGESAGPQARGVAGPLLEPLTTQPLPQRIAPSSTHSRAPQPCPGLCLCEAAGRAERRQQQQPCPCSQLLPGPGSPGASLLGRLMHRALAARRGVSLHALGPSVARPARVRSAGCDMRPPAAPLPPAPAPQPSHPPAPTSTNTDTSIIVHRPRGSAVACGSGPSAAEGGEASPAAPSWSAGAGPLSTAAAAPAAPQHRPDSPNSRPAPLSVSARGATLDKELHTAEWNGQARPVKGRLGAVGGGWGRSSSS